MRTTLRAHLALAAVAALALLQPATAATASDAGLETQSLHADGTGIDVTGDFAGLVADHLADGDTANLAFTLSGNSVHLELDHADVGVHAGLASASTPATTTPTELGAATLTGTATRAGYAFAAIPLPGNVRPTVHLTGSCLEVVPTAHAQEARSSRVQATRAEFHYDLQDAVAVHACGALRLTVTGELRLSLWETDAHVDGANGASDLQTGRLAQPGAGSQLEPAVTRDQQAFVDAVEATFTFDLPPSATVFLAQAYVRADHLVLGGARGMLASANGDLAVQGNVEVRGDPAGARIAGHGPAPFGVRLFSWTEADVGGVAAVPAAAQATHAAPGAAAAVPVAVLGAAAFAARRRAAAHRAAEA